MAKDNESNGNFLVRGIKAFIAGRIIPVGVFKKYGSTVAIGVLLVIASMMSKNDCRLSIHKIKALNKELQNAQTNVVAASAEYNTLVRESNLIKMIDTLHLDLQAPEQPPFKITEK